jgi:hypothetical protein
MKKNSVKAAPTPENEIMIVSDGRQMSYDGNWNLNLGAKSRWATV